MVCLRSINQVTSVEAGQELLSLSRYWRRSLHRRQPLRKTWKGRLPKAAFSVLWFEFSFIRTWAGVHCEVVSSETCTLCLFAYTSSTMGINLCTLIIPYPCYPPTPPNLRPSSSKIVSWQFSKQELASQVTVAQWLRSWTDSESRLQMDWDCCAKTLSWWNIISGRFDKLTSTLLHRFESRLE